METLSELTAVIAGSLTKPLAFLAVLTVIIFVHEYGHFIVARWCGVAVQTFSIGFGKELWGFNDRKGTHWRIALVPLGGYVKFAGDDSIASTPSRDVLEKMSPEERAGSFHAKPLWQRAAIVAAGPIANFILAIAIFAVMFMWLGVYKIEARIGTVMPDTPAASAGFRPGDLVVQINGNPVDEFSEIQRVVMSSLGSELEFVVDREGRQERILARPALHEFDDPIGGKQSRAAIGIKPPADPKVVHETFGPLGALCKATEETSGIVTATFKFLSDVFMRRQSTEQLGGPARIAEAAGQIAKYGLDALVRFIAFVSVSVGLLNLFPIPVLDGGHLLFYAIEAARGRPMSEQAQEIGLRIGLGIIFMLMILAFYNDRFIIWGWLPKLG